MQQLEFLHKDFFYLFQSMHPIKDATIAEGYKEVVVVISIHAPYKGCNMDFLKNYELDIEISIHAPYKGCNQTKKWPRLK